MGSCKFFDVKEGSNVVDGVALGVPVSSALAIISIVTLGFLTVDTIGLDTFGVVMEDFSGVDTEVFSGVVFEDSFGSFELTPV